MKRFIALIILFLMLFSLFGCSSSEKEYLLDVLEADFSLVTSECEYVGKINFYADKTMKAEIDSPTELSGFIFTVGPENVSVVFNQVSVNNVYADEYSPFIKLYDVLLSLNNTSLTVAKNGICEKTLVSEDESYVCIIDADKSLLSEITGQGLNVRFSYR
ncbi:MAG: hypothetical protein IKJ27_04380 [Clostridia bacterium]|nr:hypothetical protein [Clostridia bacterium]